MLLSFMAASGDGYAELIRLLAALLIPVVASLAVKTTDKARLAMALSVLHGILSAVADGSLDVAAMPTLSFEAFVMQLVAYRGFWKPVGQLNEQVDGMRIERPPEEFPTFPFEVSE